MKTCSIIYQRYLFDIMNISSFLHKSGVKVKIIWLRTAVKLHLFLGADVVLLSFCVKIYPSGHGWGWLLVVSSMLMYSLGKMLNKAYYWYSVHHAELHDATSLCKNRCASLHNFMVQIKPTNIHLGGTCWGKHNSG